MLVDPVAVRPGAVRRAVSVDHPESAVRPRVRVGPGSAACFAMADRWWLVAGALLFLVGFVVDCMDGKIARLNGTGSMFGAWFDFIFDRLRVCCAPSP